MNIKANEDNTLKYGVSTSCSVKYKKDENGNLILDENGDPIVENQSGKLEYFTE